MNALTLTDIAVAYNGHDVLESVTMSAEPGSWVTVVGPNGAGKTTLLRAILNHVPFRGEIKIAGQNTASIPQRDLAHLVASVEQNPVLPHGMRLIDYAMLGRTPYTSLWFGEAAEDLEIVRRILAQLDLDDLADRQVETLSGGEWSRATIARALAQETPIIILDEPTAALDIGRAQEILEQLDDLRRRDVTIVATMHDLTLASQYSDVLVLLSKGQVVTTGPPHRVLTKEAVERHYGAQVEVLEDGTVVPRRNHQ